MGIWFKILPIMEKQPDPLDDTDLALLNQLQLDASWSVARLADLTGLSTTTCHRRLKRLQDQGWVERHVAIVSRDKLAQAGLGGLHGLIEVTLEQQTHEALARFERAAVADPWVEQCWQVSPGPDFMLVVAVPDMPGYQQLSQRLFTMALGVRNVRTFFAVKRAKFGTTLPLPQGLARGSTS
jgi:Lrp/AsnC family transcriptional regulator, leucine-responsive regulatory protein